jgi:hypothetical protein
MGRRLDQVLRLMRRLNARTRTRGHQVGVAPSLRRRTGATAEDLMHRFFFLYEKKGLTNAA